MSFTPGPSGSPTLPSTTTDDTLSIKLAKPAARPAYDVRAETGLSMATGYETHSVTMLPTYVGDTRAELTGGAKLREQVRNAWSWQSGPQRSVEGSRINHIDSLRIVAAILILTATVIANATKTWRGADSILYPVRSDFGLVLFMVIVGRTLPVPWLEPLASSQRNGPTMFGSSVASTRELGQALLKRPFRFLGPVLFVSGLQYAVAKSGDLLSSAPALRELFGGVSALPLWHLASDKSWMALVTSLFTANDMSVTLRSAASTLYTTPWLFQGSLYILGVATFSGLFKTSSRQALYVLLAIFNWTTFSFLLPFIVGLIIADLSVCGLLEPIKSVRPAVSRRFSLAVGAQLFITAMLAMLLFAKPVREGISDGFAHMQVLKAMETVQNTSGYQLLRFSDVLSASLLVLLVEVAKPLHFVLGFRPLALSGRFLAAGLTVVHPFVLFVIVPRVYKPSLTNVEQHAGSVLGCVWIITLCLSLLCAAVFSLCAELPSQLLGRGFLWFFLPNPKQVSYMTPSSSASTTYKREDSPVPK